MNPEKKVYSKISPKIYTQSTVGKRIEALFLDNLGQVVTREQILKAAKDPVSGKEPENWHQRLSELRTDKGYTILSWRDWKALSPQEYVMPDAAKRDAAGKRVLPTSECWERVLSRATCKCEWVEDGQRCNLQEGNIDATGGGTVKLTPDHVTPHSVNPNTDTTDPTQWQALCGRHQVMKKNYWDSATGKINVRAILQSIGQKEKREALDFLLQYFGYEIQGH